jgi:hypothetical protein
MAIRWSVTIDCAHPRELASFWVIALGYQEKPPPVGFASWEAWFAHHSIPEQEWDDGAYLADPEGAAPALSFMKVPEEKIVKNRLHLDIQAGGGRETPWETRWPRVLELADRLVAAGARVVHQYEMDAKPDHLLMADPEGNEFCLL